TQSYAQTNQVLVQRKPVDWEKLKAHQLEKKLIRNPVKLLGKTIVVRKESAFYDRLLNLEDELGGDIDIQEAPAGMTMEGIIKAVDEGEYTFTLADQNIARINQTYYHDLDIETPVSFPQRLAWAVRKNAPELLAYVNQWLQEEQDQTDYYVIYNKYFKNKKAFLRRQESDYFSLTAGNISPFDSLLQQHAEQLQWDWRLLAAQVYQESRFDPKTASWAGALGLMQLMPATAQQWGVKDATKPQANLAAGTKHLAYLKKFWEKIPDPKERLKFVLASYNAGQGHIQDACRLAEKFGKNPAIWTGHVDEFILKKADPTYFQDEVVKYGYCRGTEPYNYVRDILVRFDRYQQVIDEV
ncbi:MAG: transglycosylase SLT domain-containing protein, partial [Bacteroidota bacterium]